MPTSSIPTPPAPPSKATPQQKRNSRIFAIVSAAILAIGALLGVFVHKKNTQEKAAEKVAEKAQEAPALTPGHGSTVDPGGDFVPGDYNTTGEASDPSWKPILSPPPAPAPSAEPRLLGAASSGIVSDKLPPNEGTKFELTYYFIALRPGGDPDQVKVLDCKGNLLTMASRTWFADLTMEGTGRYRDAAGESQTINVSGTLGGGGSGPGSGAGKVCWQVLDYDSRWGLGVQNQTTGKSFQLRPFRSIAVDRKILTMGAWYYIAELDGVQMPYPASNVTHDGCVRAMDVGPGIVGKHIDFYSAYESAYKTLVPITKEHITIWSGQTRCALHIARGW